MSASISLCCPHCQATGELSDFSLLGKPIQCPVCQQVFMAPMPTSPEPPVIGNPSPSIPLIAAPISQTSPPAAAIPALPLAVPIAQPVATARPVSPATPTVAPVIVPTPPVVTARPVAPNPFQGLPAIDLGSTNPSAASANSGGIPSIPETSFAQDFARSAGTSNPVRPQTRKSSGGSGLGNVLIFNLISISALLAFVFVFYGDRFGFSKARTRRSTASSKSRKPKLGTVGNPIRQPTYPPKEKPTETAEPLPVNEMPAIAEEMPAEPKIEIASIPAPKPEMQAPVKPSPNTPVETTENIPEDLERKLDEARDDQFLGTLIELVAHPHAGVRERAADRLENLTPAAAAVPALIKALADPVPAVRQNAATALGKHGVETADAIPALAKALQDDPDVNIRSYAAAALQEIGSKRPERASSISEVLQLAMSKTDGPELSSIYLAFSSLGDATKPAIPALLQRLNKTERQPELASVLAQYEQFEVLLPIISGAGIDFYSSKKSIAAGIGRMRPMTVAALGIIQKLYADPDSQVREAAIDALWDGQPKLPEAIPLIEQAQEDEDRDVRRTATTAIAAYQLEPAKKIAGMLKQYINPKIDSYERSQIEDALHLTKAEGVRALVDLLGTPETKVETRDAAAALLVGYWDYDSFDDSKTNDLKKILTTPEQPLNVRSACAVALSRMKQFDPQVIATLQEAISTATLNVKFRQQSAYAVPREDVSVVPGLLAAAETCEITLPADTTDEARQAHNDFYQAVIGVLCHTKVAAEDRPKLETRLIAALKFGSDTVKVNALEGLRFGDRESVAAVEAARSMLKHDNKEVRENANEVLGELHKVSAVAIPELREALKDKEWSVRSAAAQALGEFGPVAVDAVPDLINALNDEKAATSWAAVSLAKIAPQNEEVLSVLIKSLARESVRDDAVDALRALGPAAQSAVPTLRKLLPKSEKFVRVGILRVLGEFGESSKPAIPEMIEQLADPDAYLRGVAADSIGMLKSHAAAAVPDLIKLLSDKSPDEDPQRNAILALRKIGVAAKPAIPELEKLIASTASDSTKDLAKETLTQLATRMSDEDDQLFETLKDEPHWEANSKTLANQMPGNLSALGRMVKNPDYTVRYRSWSLLEACTSKPEIREALSKMLESVNAEERALATMLLQQFPTEANQAELPQQLALWIENSPATLIARRLFAQFGASSANEIAQILLSQNHKFETRMAILDQLRENKQLSNPLLLPLLRPGLKSDSPPGRVAAAVALARLHPMEPDILPPLLEALSSDKRELQLQAAHVIEILAGSKADVGPVIPRLCQLLVELPRAPDRDVAGESFLLRASAILSKTGARTDDLPQLREMLRQGVEVVDEGNKKDDFLKKFSAAELYLAKAIQYLGTIGPTALEALPEIKAALERGAGEGDGESNQEYESRDSYARGLEQLGEPAIKLAVDIARQKDAMPPGRRLCIQLLDLISYGDSRFIPLFQELLQDSDPSVVRRAALALVERPETLKMALTALRPSLLENAITEQELRTRDVVLEKFLRFKTDAREALPEFLQIVRDAKAQLRYRMQVSAVMAEVAPDSVEARATFLDLARSLPQDTEVYSLAKSATVFGPEMLMAIIQDLEKATDPWRLTAVRMLGEMGVKAAAAGPVLRSLIQAQPEETGLAAAIAVARIDPTAKDVAPRLFAELVKEGYPDHTLIAALKHLGPQLSNELPKILELTQVEQRKYVAYDLLGSMGPAAKPALPMLLEGATLPEPNYLAERALVGLGSDAAEIGPQLIAHIQRSDNIRASIEIITKMDDPARKLVELMRQDLKDESKRTKAVIVLNNLKTVAKPAVPELIELAKGSDKALQLAALEALVAIAPDTPEIADQLVTILTGEDSGQAQSAAYALSRMDKHALPVLSKLIAAMETANPAVQITLIYLLGDLGPAAADAAPALDSKLKTADHGQRRIIREALKKIRNPVQLPAPPAAK